MGLNELYGLDEDNRRRDRDRREERITQALETIAQKVSTHIDELYELHNIAAKLSGERKGEELVSFRCELYKKLAGCLEELRELNEVLFAGEKHPLPDRISLDRPKVEKINASLLRAMDILSARLRSVGWVDPYRGRIPQFVDGIDGEGS